MAYSTADPLNFLAIGMQSALGTPQVTAAKMRYIKYLSGTDAQPAITVVDLREGGDGLDWGYTYKQAQAVTGQIVMNARPEAGGQILQGAMGGATWDGGSAPANHTFMTGHASFPWFTMLLQYPGSTLGQMISDVKMTGFTIEGKSGEPEKWTIPFVGITHGASFAGVVATAYQEDPFVYHYSPTYVLDGVADTTLTSYTITYGLNIDQIQAQAVTLDDIAVLNRDLNVDFTRRYVNASHWIQINMLGGINPTQTVATGSFRTKHLYGTGAGLRSLEHNLPLLSYRALSLAQLDPDGKTVEETFSAKALKSGTHAMFSFLANNHASAYSP